jgi:type IV pilus assembly protein PilO
VALNAQDALASLNKLPLAQKIAVLVFVVGGISAANYFFLVQPEYDQITSQEGVLRRLEDDLTQKQAIANNLAQFKHEKEILERRLTQALTELPNEANIGELIHSLADIGQKAGLTINDIAPQPEQRQSFYASIPIAMQVTGNYHEIGVFLDALSKLPRIVNVTNIKMGSPKMQGDKLVVQATYMATTFRFLPEAETTTTATAKPGARGATK